MQTVEISMQQLNLKQSLQKAPSVFICKGLTRIVPKDNSEPNLKISSEIRFLDATVEEETPERFSPKNYTLTKRLGNGSFGEVFLATSIFGDVVVMKRISKKNDFFKRKYVDRETEAGAILSQHDNILACRAHFETANNVYLVLPYFDGLDIITWMEQRRFIPLEENEAKHLLRQIVNAILYCHKNGIGHRDIKCENILVDNQRNVKVIDFGLCSVNDDKDLVQREIVGSLQYLAPEVIIHRRYKSFQSDVFSTGMVLFCLIFGQFPFNQDERFAVLQSREKFPCPGELPFKVSKTLEDLLVQMMEAVPEKRITMEEIANHQWLVSE